MDLVGAFDSDVRLASLAEFGMPPHQPRVIGRMNTDLQVAFEPGGDPAAVP